MLLFFLIRDFLGTSRIYQSVICYSPADVVVMADDEAAEGHIHRGRLRIAIVGVRKENVPP